MKQFLIYYLEKLIEKRFIFFLRLYVLSQKKVELLRPQSDQVRISVINTNDISGGASRIALDLASEIRKSTDLIFYVKYKKSNQNWIKKIGNKESNLFSFLLKKSSKNKGWIEFCGFDAQTLINDSFYVKSNIVHLHNLHDEFFSPFLFKSLFSSKKILWTIHDESIYTGHCSCTLGCQKWMKGCGTCPSLDTYPSVSYDNTKQVFEYKIKIIQNLDPVFICPSEWIADRVKLIYPKQRIEVIHNGVDTTIFRQTDQIVARKKMGFPFNKKIILFVAEYSTSNPFKGGEIVRNLITDIEFKDCLFVTVGEKKKFINQNHIGIGYVDNPLDLSILYSAADILLYPTRADNFPLVVLESMSCGTPVISSDIGGISEIITHNSDGFLVSNYSDVHFFKLKLKEFFSLDYNSINLIKKSSIKTVKAKFTKNKMVSKYQELYNELNSISI